jgi:peptidylprolyl isomerase
LRSAPPKRLRRGLSLTLTAIVLIAAACGGDDADGDVDVARTLANPSTSTPAATTDAPAATGDRAVARDGDTVAVHYHGTLDSGEVFDSSRERDPFVFVVGAGQVITGFDEMVRGLAAGEKVTRRLEPADAYGERNEQLVIDVPPENLPPGSVVGDSVRFSNGASGTIIEITETNARVDANHRYAGQALTFELELVEIR